SEFEKPRPFRVIGKVEGRTCTVRLARPTNTGDPLRNPAEALAIQRVQQKAAAMGAAGVTNLSCMREIRIGFACPTAVVCTADAIAYDGE
ncbi:MAG TPA: hypothetical protein VHL59_02115, partial [Thermoanaerobaculia bacterium]|nr:hypothetical protein [Thermoanaerobaculia bacterium]